MAEGGFDPCECINLLNHEGRMQRLISMLRESQSYCTDGECYSEGDGLLSNNVNGENSPMMWTYMIGLVILAIVLYLLRPSASRADKGKPRFDDNGQGRDEEPVL